MTEEYDSERFERARDSLTKLVRQFTYGGSICMNDDEIEINEEIAKQEDEMAIEVLKTIPIPAILNGYISRFSGTTMRNFDEELKQRARYLQSWLTQIEDHSSSFFSTPGVAPNKDIDSGIETKIANIVLITVNSIESKAVYDTFEAVTKTKAVPVRIDSRTYHDLGTINGVRVIQALSEMGSSGPGGALQTVEKAIAAFNPSAVIAIGIAFGIDESKQKIGDILVSEQLLLYESQRVGRAMSFADRVVGWVLRRTNSSGSQSPSSLIPRGDRPRASVKLGNFFKTFQHAAWTGAKVHFGLLLSGEKLIDNLDYRNQIRTFAPECLGGEMEGVGVYVASHDKRVDWIVVKAICDWADGNKASGKDEHQTQAAKNAVEFVLAALQYAKLPPSG